MHAEAFTALEESAHSVAQVATGGIAAAVHIHRRHVTGGIVYGECVGFSKPGTVATIAAAAQAAHDLVGTPGYPAPTGQLGAWVHGQAQDDNETVVGSPADAQHTDDAKLAMASAHDQVIAIRSAALIVMRNWNAIVAVADKLLEHGLVHGTAVHRICKQHNVQLFIVPTATPVSTAHAHRRALPRSVAQHAPDSEYRGRPRINLHLADLTPAQHLALIPLARGRFPLRIDSDLLTPRQRHALAHLLADTPRALIAIHG